MLTPTYKPVCEHKKMKVIRRDDLVKAHQI